jgi:hypothetical protein
VAHAAPAGAKRRPTSGEAAGFDVISVSVVTQALCCQSRTPLPTSNRATQPSRECSDESQPGPSQSGDSRMASGAGPTRSRSLSLGQGPGLRRPGSGADTIRAAALGEGPVDELERDRSDPIGRASRNRRYEALAPCCDVVPPPRQVAEPVMWRMSRTRPSATVDAHASRLRRVRSRPRASLPRRVKEGLG